MPMNGQNGQVPLFLKMFCNLPLFGKYLAISHFFETRFCELELHQKISKFFHDRTRVPWKTRLSQNRVLKKVLDC